MLKLSRANIDQGPFFSMKGNIPLYFTSWHICIMIRHTLCAMVGSIDYYIPSFTSVALND